MDEPFGPARARIEPRPDRKVYGYGIRKRNRIVRFHVPPAGVIRIGAERASRFDRLRILPLLAPGQAMPPVHLLFDQRPAVPDEGDPRILHPDRFIRADADPLFDSRDLWPALAFLKTGQLANLAQDRADL